MTVPWLMEMPCPSLSSAWTRRIPYEPCEAVWMVVMASVSHECRRERGEGGRERQA